jgi:predicted flap endonuclease-1-like 5' DNA nuclease
MPRSTRENDEDWSNEEEEGEWEDEEEEIDVEDLTQLPGINKKLERKLKERGYDTLYEIGEADVNDLAKDAGVTRKEAKQMIDTANKLLGFEEEE